MRVIENGSEPSQATIQIVLAVDTFTTEETTIPVNILVNGKVAVKDFQVTLEVPEVRPWAFEILELDRKHLIEVCLGLEVDMIKLIDTKDEISSGLVTRPKESELPITVTVEPTRTGDSVVVQFFAISYIDQTYSKDYFGEIYKDRHPAVILAETPAISSHEDPWSYTWDKLVV